MPGIHHQVSRSTIAPAPDELGRVGWLVIGLTVLVIGATAHALSGIIAIAKDMLRPASRSASTGGGPAPAARLSLNEKEGWILIGSLIIMSGAVGRALAEFIAGIRKAAHATHRRART
ncbi:hypothetical protein [Kitasatospora sp. NPDC097691]|uniref:hypothetical protein n=1 Tax=Kitasatospora sp. NPDC097691 TaxID=3157231 RepID=UPI00331D3A8A